MKTNFVQTRKEDKSRKATWEKFSKIKTRITYQQVVDIMWQSGLCQQKDHMVINQWKCIIDMIQMEFQK